MRKDLPYNSGREHILYVNGQYKGEDDLGKLMHDFLCSDPNDMHFDILAERSRYYKENPKGVSEMCKAMEDMRNEALERGRIEGRAEGRLNNMIESVRSLKAKLGLSDQQVEDSADMYYYDHTRGFLDSRYNDREVTRSVANSMAEAYAFVLDKGIVLQEIEPMIRSYYRDGGYDADSVARMTYVDTTEWVNDITGRKNNGIGVTRPLEKRLRDSGVPFLMNYHMDAIVREGGSTGRVEGIVASYSPTILPGETEPLTGFFSEGNIDCTKANVSVRANKAVIVCTGGSIGNVNFRTMFDSRLGPEFDGLAGMPFSDQDASGELAALKISAAMGSAAGYMVDDGAAIVAPARMGCQYGYGNGFDENSKVWKLFRSRGIVPDYRSMIVVNMLG